MGHSTRRVATYADLVAASDLLIAEIIFGRLVTHRRGDPRHNRTVSFAQHASRAAVPAREAATRCLDGSSFGPRCIWALMWWCPTWLLGAAGASRPSPKGTGSTSRRIGLARCYRLKRKDAIGARSGPSTAKAGVCHLWLVDPASRTLEAFELRSGKWLLLDVFRDDAKVAVAPFANLDFSLEPALALQFALHRSRLDCAPNEGLTLCRKQSSCRR